MLMNGEDDAGTERPETNEPFDSEAAPRPGGTKPEAGRTFPLRQGTLITGQRPRDNRPKARSKNS
jgi:hypothetical protein